MISHGSVVIGSMDLRIAHSCAMCARRRPISLSGIASVVGFTELLNNARNVQALTYNATPIVAAALIYLIVLWPLVRLVSRLEHKSIALR